LNDVRRRSLGQRSWIAGDPSFLAAILRCIDLRCKILGLHAPTTAKADVTTEALEELVKARRLKLLKPFA